MSECITYPPHSPMIFTLAVWPIGLDYELVLIIFVMPIVDKGTLEEL